MTIANTHRTTPDGTGAARFVFGRRVCIIQECTYMCFDFSRDRSASKHVRVAITVYILPESARLGFNDSSWLPGRPSVDSSLSWNSHIAHLFLLHSTRIAILRLAHVQCRVFQETTDGET